MESSPLTAVRPTKPAAGYIGGKRNLSRRLVEMIAATPHSLYAEPFVGMGGVFFRRTARPSMEVINDWSADVATLFRVLQRHYVAFLDMLRFQLTTREGFERLQKVDPSTLTDLERAARFLYLQRLAFGGKVNGRNFGAVYEGGARFDVTKLQPMLEDIHCRLAGVVIERLPYAEFIRRYDRPGALFFIDPPYWGNEDDYGPGMFSEADFGLLRAVLEGLQGRFVMTLNDRPEVRALFARFDVQSVTLTYRVSGLPTEGKEVIIRGG
jgi:DNA adenine methylase